MSQCGHPEWHRATNWPERTLRRTKPAEPNSHRSHARNLGSAEVGHPYCRSPTGRLQRSASRSPEVRPPAGSSADHRPTGGRRTRRRLRRFAEVRTPIAGSPAGEPPRTSTDVVPARGRALVEVPTIVLAADPMTVNGYCIAPGRCRKHEWSARGEKSGRREMKKDHSGDRTSNRTSRIAAGSTNSTGSTS